MSSTKSNGIKMLIVALVALTAVAQSQAAKVSGTIDIAVVMDETNMKNSANLRTALVKFFGGHFEIANVTTRLAVVQPMTSASTNESVLVNEKIALEMTGDFKRFKGTVENMTFHEFKMGTTTYRRWTHLALRAINEIVFPTVSTRAQVVVFGFSGGSEAMDRVQEEVQKLTNQVRGIRIYALAVDDSFYVGKAGFTFDYEKESVEPGKVLVGRGNEDNLVIIKDESEDSFVDGLIKIKDRMVSDLCGWTVICRYEVDSKSECKPDGIQENKMSKTITGGCPQDRPSVTCGKDDCRQTCDKKWPWRNPVEAVDCKKPSFCGTVVKRVGSKPNDAGSKWVSDTLQKHCDHELKCSPCPESKALNKTNLEKELAQQNKEKATKVTWLIVVLVLLIVVLVVACGVAIAAFVMSRKTEKKTENQKMETLMETITHMSTYVSQQTAAANASTAADLPDLDQSTRRLKSMIKSPSSKEMPKPSEKPKESSEKSSKEAGKKPGSPSGSVGSSSIKTKEAGKKTGGKTSPTGSAGGSSIKSSSVKQNK